MTAEGATCLSIFAAQGRDKKKKNVKNSTEYLADAVSSEYNESEIKLTNPAFVAGGTASVQPALVLSGSA